MRESITETLKKINIELSGSTFLSLFLSLICLNLFLGYKIVSSQYFVSNGNFQYIESDFSKGIGNNSKEDKYFIYASKKGKKYYYYNCRATIKEENKIFFDSDAAALKAGYTLSKTCK